MKTLIEQSNNLPATLDELSRFVLIGREKLTSVRAEIRTIEKLELAGGVREQKMKEAKMLAGALLDAEARVGELMIETPKATNKNRQNDNNVVLKGEKAKEIGFSIRQTQYFQKMAKNKDIIEEVKAEAEKKDNLPTRTEVLKKIKEKERKARRVSRIIKLPSDLAIDLRCGDFRELVKSLPDNSVDLILCDPPYPKEYLPLWKDLSKEAQRVLKPGKFLVTYSGQAYLPEIISSLSENLEYYWLGMLYHKSAIGQRFEVHMLNRAKPILFFYKPPLKKQETWIEDVVVSDSGDKDFHEWGQSVNPCIKLIEAFSQPGDIVLDPMFGGGSVIEAAIETKRNIIGFEIEKEVFQMVKSRVGIDGGNVLCDNDISQSSEQLVNSRRLKSQV